MKIIDLLNKIANSEMEEAVFYVNGDFFYDLIVINENLYVINTRTKQLELLESKYISRFIRDNVELIRLDNFEEILEEEKKIPEKLENEHEFYSYAKYEENKNEIDKVLYILKAINLAEEKIGNLNNSINEIIDYLKSKGDE